MFVRGANPIWSFVDLIGHQLDDTYYISFLSNTFPYLPQTVYHDNQGSIPWSQPIEFLANGTLDPDIFGNPNLVYRIEIRQGLTQFDPLIYVVNNYIFGDSSGGGSSNDNNQENQISNPQFAIVNFLNSFGNTDAPNPQININTAGTYEIAPGWQLVLMGSGTSTITQVIANGAENKPDNIFPPYYLDIVTAGWTSAILQQKLNGNGAIWYNNYVAASILVKSNDSIAHPISVSYVPNSPGAPVEIISSVPVNVGTFTYIQGVVALFPPTTPVSANTTPNNNAFVQIQIALPSTGTIDISNIQLFGIENNPDITIDSFNIQPEETIERQQDHLAHYYNPKLAFKPIPSWLRAWDFPLNPAQLGSSFSAPSIGANKSQYTWDCTIVFQSTNNGVSITRGNQGGIQIGASATTQAAIIQYIEAPIVNKILRTNVAVNLVGSCAASTTLKGTVSLWYTKSSLPSVAVGTNNSLIATIDANGKPATFNGTWTEVPLKIGQEATFTLTPTITEFDFPFWQPPIESEIENATFMAVVIGFQSIPMGTINPEIISCSLNSGDVSTIPPAESTDEVLRKCQYLYEQSYLPGIASGTATDAGIQLFNGTIFNNFSTNNCFLYPNQINLNFKTIKRATPNMTIYSRDGTINSIYFALRVGNTLPTATFGTNPGNANISIWNGANVSTYNLVLAVTTGTGGNLLTECANVQNAGIGEHYLHYVADSRLGIV